jgi:hypothetical protein
MAITNGYTTLAVLKSSMRIPADDTMDDALLETAIESASRQIDGHCERVFYSGTATRVYTPNDNFVTETDDIVSISSLMTTSDGSGFDTTWTATDYQLEPLNGVAGGLVSPATQIRAVGNYIFTVIGKEATVQVTGTFGWSSVPVAIKQATLILAQRQFKRYDSPLGVAGFGDIGVVRVSRIDPDVASLIAPFRRVRVA